jgi:hypothetical protein
MNPRGRPRHSGARGRTPRDQEETAFAPILRALLARVPGAGAAVLVDFHGETVDYAGRGPPFDLRVAAAHWRIVLHDVAAQRALARVRWLVVGAGHASYLVYALPDDYALVVLFARTAGFVGWQRAVATCANALGAEAGWAARRAPAVEWRPVRVSADARLRPRFVHVGGRPRAVEILGMLVTPVDGATADAAPGSAGRERGWRVRLQTGIEATVVREPGGAWYVDESLDDPVEAPSLAPAVRRATRAASRRKTR